MASECHAEAYWTAPRQELRAWFQRNAPSLGELYEGALRMVFDSQFPGRTRYVAHAVREIRNHLPDVIAGIRSGGPLPYVNRMDDIAEKWKKAGFALDGSSPTSVTDKQSFLSADVPVPRHLFLKIASFVRDHMEAREKRSDAAFRLFGAISPENQQLRDTLRPAIHQWLEVTERFVKMAHDSGIQDNDIDGAQFQSDFQLFETTLGALVRGFFKTVEGLDEILEDANS